MMKYFHITQAKEPKIVKYIKSKKQNKLFETYNIFRVYLLMREFLEKYLILILQKLT